MVIFSAKNVTRHFLTFWMLKHIVEIIIHQIRSGVKTVTSAFQPSQRGPELIDSQKLSKSAIEIETNRN